MENNLLKQVFNSDSRDAIILNTGFNMGVAWIFGNTVNIISNSLFNFNLNQYNSVAHFVGGIGIGTVTYRKAGGGLKGILAGMAAATISNIVWEGIENKYVFHSNPFTEEQAFIDTLSDIAVVYAGAAISSLAERLKGYKGNREKYPNRKEKWVL